MEEFSARLRMLEIDLRTSQEETRVLKQDVEEAHKKTDLLEISKVQGMGGGEPGEGGRTTPKL